MPHVLQQPHMHSHRRVEKSTMLNGRGWALAVRSRRRLLTQAEDPVFHRARECEVARHGNGCVGGLQREAPLCVAQSLESCLQPTATSLSTLPIYQTANGYDWSDQPHSVLKPFAGLASYRMSHSKQHAGGRMFAAPGTTQTPLLLVL